MVKINSSNGGAGKLGARNNPAGSIKTSGCLPTICMLILGCLLATVTSHLFIFGEKNNDNTSPDALEEAGSLAIGNTLLDSSSKIMNSAATEPVEEYYDSLFKNPLKVYEDKLKTLPNAPNIASSSPTKGENSAPGAFDLQPNGMVNRPGNKFSGGPGGRPGVQGVPHSGAFLNAETMYPVGPNFKDEIKTIPNQPLNITFLTNAAGKSKGSKHLPVNGEEIPPSAFESSRLKTGTVDPEGLLESSQKSIFDCDSPHGKCIYFYPSHFFSNETVKQIEEKDGNDAVTGPEAQYTKGGSFYYLLETMEALLKARKLWLNMPYIGMWTMSFGPHRINPVTQQPFTRQNVTFIHIHKTGGTTIVRHANSQMTMLTGKPTSQFRVFMWQWLVSPNVDTRGRPMAPQRLRGFNGPNPEDRTKMQKLMFDKAVNHIRTATTFQSLADQSWSPSDHELFAIVRDPLDRFVSAIGQAMGALGSTKNGVAGELKANCLNSEEYSLEASQFTLQCMVDMIKEKDFFFEIHFTPQAVETAFATQMLPDTPIALFHMDHLSEVLTEIGCDPKKKVRDGGKNYRPSKVLAGMTSNDYTPDLLKQVCQLYEVDVIMMRTLGHEVPRCDEYIPKKL